MHASKIEVRHTLSGEWPVAVHTDPERMRRAFVKLYGLPPQTVHRAEQHNVKPMPSWEIY